MIVPGGFEASASVAPLVGALVERLPSSARVSGYDRPNCGADIRIDDSISEFHLWADSLASDFSEDRTRLVLGGVSAGAVASLLFAHLFPELLESLVLIEPPSDVVEDSRWIAEERYLKSAAAAAEGGMHAVCQLVTAWIDWPALTRPRAKRAMLMGHDPDEFATRLRR